MFVYATLHTVLRIVVPSPIPFRAKHYTLDKQDGLGSTKVVLLKEVLCIARV